MKTTIYTAFVLLIFISCKNEKPHPPNVIDLLNKGQWIDLTYNFDENTIYWPTNSPFKHDTVAFGITEKGFFYSSGSYAADEHGGTHLDAPIHFAAEKKSVDQISVDQMTGEGILIDVSKNASGNSDYLVTVEDFQNWESKNGKIPDNATILLFTGHGKYWNQRDKYIGTSMTGPEAVPELHFPGLDPKAAKWLVDHRKIKGIGLDTPSIDYGQSEDFMAHQILSEKEILIFENVANLEKIPAKGFYVVAFPMKIKGGTGAPLRIAAFLPS